MHPFTCPDGKEHSFDVDKSVQDEEVYICTECGTSYSTYEAAHLKRVKIENIIKEMSEYINGGNPELLAEMFFIAMEKEHRTLQQSFIRSIALFIKMMSKMPTDLRNQAAVEWCKKVSEIEAVFPRV